MGSIAEPGNGADANGLRSCLAIEARLTPLFRLGDFVCDFFIGGDILREGELLGAENFSRIHSNYLLSIKEH